MVETGFLVLALFRSWSQPTVLVFPGSGVGFTRLVPVVDLTTVVFAVDSSHATVKP